MPDTTPGELVLRAKAPNRGGQNFHNVNTRREIASKIDAKKIVKQGVKRRKSVAKQ